jgi:hypothetical protein
VAEVVVNIWLNIGAFLVFVGAAFYLSLLPYMTRD